MSKKKTAAATEEVLVETQETQETPETTEMPVTVCAPSGLNLRAGPGLSYPITFILENGTAVEPLDLPATKAAPGWVPILTGLRLGWVDGRFLRGLEE